MTKKKNAKKIKKTKRTLRSKSKQVVERIVSSEPELISVTITPVEQKVATKKEQLDTQPISEPVYKTKQINVSTNLIKTSHFDIESVADSEPETTRPIISECEPKDDNTVITLDLEHDEEEPVIVGLNTNTTNEIRSSQPLLNEANFLNPDAFINVDDAFGANNNEPIVNFDGGSDNWFSSTIATASRELFADDNSPFEILKTNDGNMSHGFNQQPEINNKVNVTEPIILNTTKVSDIYFIPEQIQVNKIPEEIVIPVEEVEPVNVDNIVQLVESSDEVQFVYTDKNNKLRPSVSVKEMDYKDSRFFLPNGNRVEVAPPTFIEVKRVKLDIQKPLPMLPAKSSTNSQPRKEATLIPLVISKIKQAITKKTTFTNLGKKKSTQAKTTTPVAKKVVVQGYVPGFVDEPRGSKFDLFKSTSQLVSPSQPKSKANNKKKSTSKTKKQSNKIRSLSEYKKNKSRGPELIFGK